ncbi:MAG: hypothetical protein JNM56_22465 [Planctomycetia bacterium]|nr:hypothetical protein [Planctomycetia bacterium]
MCLSPPPAFLDFEEEGDLDERAVNFGSRPLPAAPTNTAPGSEARIRVLEERFARGWSLFHPDDARIDWSHQWSEQLPAVLRRRVHLNGEL